MNFCSDSVSGKYISDVFLQYVIANLMNKRAELCWCSVIEICGMMGKCAFLVSNVSIF